MTTIFVSVFYFWSNDHAPYNSKKNLAIILHTLWYSFNLNSYLLILGYTFFSIGGGIPLEKFAAKLIKICYKT